MPEPENGSKSVLQACQVLQRYFGNQHRNYLPVEQQIYHILYVTVDETRPLGFVKSPPELVLYTKWPGLFWSGIPFAQET